MSQNLSCTNECDHADDPHKTCWHRADESRGKSDEIYRIEEAPIRKGLTVLIISISWCCHQEVMRFCWQQFSWQWQTLASGWLVDHSSVTMLGSKRSRGRHDQWKCFSMLLLWCLACCVLTALGARDGASAITHCTQSVLKGARRSFAQYGTNRWSLSTMRACVQVSLLFLLVSTSLTQRRLQVLSQYVQIYIDLSLSLSLDMCLWSGPSLASLRVIIWAKFVFYRYVLVRKHYKNRGSAHLKEKQRLHT